jgi:diadenosine tetraphosphate (Ap4A) HIT family hydrolase
MGKEVDLQEDRPLESKEEGRHITIFETENYRVCAYGRPHVSREEGGHIIIAAKGDITDRTKLTPQLAKEYMRLSMIVGEAMEKAMNIRGIPVVKINYADSGNWAFKRGKKPRMHMHVFGRAVNAKHQVFPEAVYLPARESGFYDSFEPLNDEDIKEIQKQISLLENTEKYKLENW